MERRGFPKPPPAIPATPIADLDAVVNRVRAQRERWARLSIDERLGWLEGVLERSLASSAEWGALCAQAKGFWPDQPEAGEEVLFGPVVSVRITRLLLHALRDVRDFGAPRLPGDAFSQRPDGRLVVRVFPTDVLGQVELLQYRSEVWMQPGVTRENLAQHQAETYRQPDLSGQVGLVLGAGNQSAIPITDALHMLFVDKHVCVLKMNPVNEFLGPVFERIFAPMIAEGFFAVVYGGAEVGAHLCQHPGIDHIHITGSEHTHDQIVWGPKDGREERKKRGERVLQKEITSELGNVTPIIVAATPWSRRELEFQAKNVASMVTTNASFNCIAGKLVVTSRHWPQRDEFLALLRKELVATPVRKAYYPGARDRWALFAAHPNAEVLVPDAPDTVPWTLLSGLDSAKTDELCYRMEPFCGVLHEVPLDAGDPAEFFRAAADFCNDRVWGTLGISVLVPSSVHADARFEAAYQDCLDRLRYGTIAVNTWSGVGFGLGSTTWGAYPGHTLEDIQSGRGVVHNTFLFDKPEKSVLYGPTVPMLTPPWLVGHRNVPKLAARLVEFEASPSLFRLMKILPHAMG